MEEIKSQTHKTFPPSFDPLNATTTSDSNELKIIDVLAPVFLI